MLYRLLLLSLIVILLPREVRCQGEEEFNGPFKSWANVKTRFGAKADGKADDTYKLQAALDNLSNRIISYNEGRDGYMVIYLPAGVYRITQTLVLSGKIGVSIIGEDPKKTIIKWDGPANDTMLWANGSAYFKIARVTWMAEEKKGIEAIGIHWKNRWNEEKSKSNAPVSIELSDLTFTGMAVGIGGGTYGGLNGTGNNDSEVTIRRCTFNQCTNVGIRITGFNALDYWIWHCKFIRCQYGIYSGNGNYHAYKSYFEGSLEGDFLNNGGYYTSVRECFSTGAKFFSKDEGVSCNPFKRVFEKNTVLNYIEPPIQYYHLGSVSLVDNIFSSPNTKAKADIGLGSWCPGIYSVLSVNNQYQFKEPIYLVMPQKKVVQVDDRLSKEGILASKTFFTSLPQSLVYKKRQVFEVPPNASSFEIQTIINKAALLKGAKPIVHFGFGKYYVDKTIIIPAGSDMQLIGDGLLYATQLLFRNKSTSDAGPVFRVKGPSYISIRDMQIGNHTGNYNNSYVGIAFEGIDNPGSKMIIDQLHSSANNSLFLDGLNFLYVEKNNSFFSEGNYISGGNVQRSGKGTFRVNCYGGQYGRLTVRNNADFMAKDCWWEGLTRVPLNLSGDGNITIDGAKVAPINADSLPTISINRFAGRVSLLNMYIQGGLSINPNNDRLKFLGWNLHFYHKMAPLAFLQKKVSFQGLFMGIHSQCFDNSNPACKSIESHKEMQVNIKDTTFFIRDMISQTRKKPPVTTISKQVSNIYISRLSVGSFNVAIKVVSK